MYLWVVQLFFTLFSSIFAFEFFLQDKCNIFIIIRQAVFILEGKLILRNIVWTNILLYMLSIETILWSDVCPAELFRALNMLVYTQ